MPTGRTPTVALREIRADNKCLAKTKGSLYHGKTGAGPGAEHQRGRLVAKLLEQSGAHAS